MCMGMHGCALLRMDMYRYDIHEYAWICIHMGGYACICMDVHGYAWICIHMRGYACICMDVHGYAWICADMRGYEGVSE